MKQAKKLISLALSLALLCAATALLGSCKKPEPGVPTTYPYVFVHGLNGFGDDTFDSISYWGSTTGVKLMSLLQEDGYECYAPSVATMGSAWDRACELYAQLTGSRVDYGKAHSEKYGHDRYGKTFDAPLFPGWGTVDEDDNLRKVNLIGHSFGGATIRLMAALLKQGNEAERTASPEDCSPLFTGGKEDWVFSLTCLASPHNGTSLFAAAQEFMGSSGGKMLLGILQTGENRDLTGILKLLDSMGLANIFGVDLTGLGDLLQGSGAKVTGKEIADTLRLLGTPDNAYYDLAIPGAEELNRQIGTVKDTYYFSYPVDGTEDADGGAKRIPTNEMIAILKIPARIVGGWTGTAGTVTIDQEWLPNDGLVNTISATAPFLEPSETVEGAMDWSEARPNRWYVMPTVRGDHGTLIGMGKDEAYLKTFYGELLGGIDTLSKQVTGAPR